MDYDTLAQFSAIIFNAIEKCAKSDDQYGQLCFYDHVGVLTHKGIPLTPSRALPRDLIRNYSRVELGFNSLTIIMRDDSRIVLMPENNPQRRISMTDNIYQFKHVRMLYKGEFIELPDARYYCIEQETLTFYTERFETINRIISPDMMRVYMDEIKTFVSFDTCTIINGYVFKVGNVTRDGNWLSGIDMHGSDVKLITPDQKCAFASLFGQQIIHNGHQSYIYIYPLDMYRCSKARVPYDRLQNARSCKHVYEIADLYFGETREGEIIQLHFRSANSGGRTKPAIRQLADEVATEVATEVD